MIGDRGTLPLARLTPKIEVNSGVIGLRESCAILVHNHPTAAVLIGPPTASNGDGAFVSIDDHVAALDVCSPDVVAGQRQGILACIYSRADAGLQICPANEGDRPISCLNGGTITGLVSSAVNVAGARPAVEGGGAAPGVAVEGA